MIYKGKTLLITGGTGSLFNPLPSNKFKEILTNTHNQSCVESGKKILF